MKSERREFLLVVFVLFLIFVVFLPQFIDYGQVVDAMLDLTIGQIVLLAVLGAGKTWFDAGVYNSLIPGLGWWDGSWIRPTRGFAARARRGPSWSRVW